MRKQKTATGSLSEVERKSWKSLFVTSSLVGEVLDDALNKAGLGSQSEYDFLYTLEQAEGGAMTLTEIAATVAITHSGLSRMADRLESRGYVARRSAVSDKRTVQIQLLDAGRRRIDDVWEVLSASLREHYADFLTEDEHAELQRLLGKVLNPLASAKEQKTGLPYLHRP